MTHQTPRPAHPQAILTLPLYVQNANMVTSPLTWGFPAPSAFTGFVHALGLRLAAHPAFSDLILDGVGILCHDFQPQTSTPAGKHTHVLNLTRNPLDKDGSTAAIIEEGRAHLEVTLLIGLRGKALVYQSSKDARKALAADILAQALSMRLAGGSLFPSHSPRRKFAMIDDLPQDEESIQKLTRSIRHRFLPSFALKARHDLLASRVAELAIHHPEATPLDALLDLSRLNIECTADDRDPGKGIWTVKRKPGWLVPLPVGYAAISALYPAGHVKNTRDANTPFRFVESILTIGEWTSPHRLTDLRELLWYHHADVEAGLYQCTQPFQNLTHSTTAHV